MKTWPQDERGQPIYPGEVHLSAAQRAALSATVLARVAELGQAQNSDPTGRRPFTDDEGNALRKDRTGCDLDYYGVGSNKAHGLETLEDGPSAILAAVRKGNGNAVERRVREAIMKADPEMVEHLERTDAARKALETRRAFLASAAPDVVAQVKARQMAAGRKAAETRRARLVEQVA